MNADTITREVALWVLSNPEVAAALVTTLAGAGGAARHYRRTGTVPLRTLPWRALRVLIYRLRRHLFTTSAPAADDLVTVDESLETVATRIGRQSYELQWPLSFHYRGEDLNARRYYYDPSREYPHRQLHIRGWERDDGSVDLYAHEEASAIHHPRRHLSGHDMAPATTWVGERYGNANGLDPRGFDISSG